MRSLIWMAPALLLAAGCGPAEERKDPCEDVTCGVNAQCSQGSCVCDDGFSGNAEVSCQPDDPCKGVLCGFNATCSAGACQCNAGFEGNADEACTPVAKCTDTSCNGNGACEVKSGAIVCECDEGYAGATCAECATGFAKEGGECVAADLCKDVECGANGSCVVEDGTAACECATGWAGDACDACADGYDNVEGACLNKNTVACEPAATPVPANASVTNAQVEITFVDGNWTTAATCKWDCDAGFDDYNNEDACLNETMTACVHGIMGYPDNSHVSNPQVPVMFDGTNWSSPDMCKWECNEGFDDYNDEGKCVSTVEVACAPATDPVPDNASVTNALVTITYDADAKTWTDAAECKWECDEGFNDYNDGGLCVNTVEVACAPADPVPDNASVTNALVTITYDADADKWTDAATCQWECDEGFGVWGEPATCETTAQMRCTMGIVPIPENSSLTNEWVEVTFTNGAWTNPDLCEWECNSGYRESADGRSCVAEPVVGFCSLLSPTLTGRSDEEHAIGAMVGLEAGGDLSMLLGQVCTDNGDPQCVDAEWDGADLGPDFYMYEGKLTLSAGEYRYHYRFSSDEGRSWTLCGMGSAIQDLEAQEDLLGTATISPSPAEQLAAIRGAVSGAAIDLLAENVVVTTVVDDLEDGMTRFFVQASPTGPAVYVEIASMPDVEPSVGQEIKFRALKVETLAGGVVAVVELSDYAVYPPVHDMEDFVQELSAVDNLVADLDDYESERVALNVVVTGMPVDTGDGLFVAAARTVPGGEVVDLRMGASLMGTLAPAAFDTIIENECEMSLEGMMWRNGETPQPTVYNLGSGSFNAVNVECSMFFGVMSATSTSNGKVELTFTTPVDPASLADFETKFVFNPPLAVTDVQVDATDARVLVLTTASQAATPYVVTVSDVFDVDARPVNLNAATAEFNGTCDDTFPVIISQVYGGGGNSGSFYKNDFVELFNRSGEDISLNGWSVQYRASAGWTVTNLSGTIKANSFYLIQHKAGTSTTGGTTLLVDPDLVAEDVNMAANNASVALVNGTTALVDCPETGFVDLVGFGRSSACALGVEGTATASAVNSAVRVAVCEPSLDNGTDFVAAPAAPRNRHTAPVVCANICEE